MSITIRLFRLVHLKRSFIYLTYASLLSLLVLCGVNVVNPRDYNHFLFRVRHCWSGHCVRNFSCFLCPTNKTFLYEDITLIPVAPRSIFFLETSCTHEAGVQLSPRQACSVESAARLNPKSQVYVVIVASVRNRTRSSVIETLYEYDNIKIVQVDLDRFFNETPLQGFYNEDKILTSLWPMPHMSDILRYTTLYKYGGTYIDLDFIITQSLEDLHNYAGAETDVAVDAGIISLDKNHPFAGAAMKELKAHFAPTNWGANGPGVITRLLKNKCGFMNYSSHINTCANFTVYPPPYFYPIYWRQWADYLNASLAPSTMAKLRYSYGAHVWNSFTKGLAVDLQSDQPYAQLARAGCPKIVALAGDQF